MSLTIELTKWNFQDLCRKHNSLEHMSNDALSAIFEYLDDLSDDVGEDISFDPSLVWEWEEYTEKELRNEYYYLIEGDRFDSLDEELELLFDELENCTTVIELDNGNYLVREF